MKEKELSKFINVFEQGGKRMNDLRIKVKDKKEANEIIELLNEIFEIKQESEIKKENNYYIDLKVEKKEKVKSGRKKKFTPMQEEMIKMYRLQGKSITDLAEIFECSRGLIHKIINQ